MSRRHRLFPVRINRQAAEKIGRKIDAFISGESGHLRTPFPRDVIVLLPLVDGFTIDGLASESGQSSGNGSPATEIINEGAMHDPVILRHFIGEVNDDKNDDPVYRRLHTSSVPNNKAKSYNPYAIACGERLRKARVALGYPKLRRFAELTGVHEDSLSAWELGKNHVPASYIQQLKELFGISHDWIFGNDASCMRQDLSVKILNTVLDED